MVTCSFPLISSVKREATSADTFTAKTKKLKHGDVIELYGIGAINLNSASKVVDIGIIRGNKPFYMRSLTLTTAGIWYYIRFHVKIPSEYQILFRIVTPTDGDAFIFNIFGNIEQQVDEHLFNDK